jgi:hypothetical protein
VAAEVARLEERLLLATHILGPESLVNTATAGLQALAATAGRAVATTDAGTAITVWTSTDSAGSRIVAQLTAADGSPLGAEIEVAAARRGQVSDATVSATGDGRFVVAWSGRDASGAGVLARVFTADGSPATDPVRVNATAWGNQSAPSVAWLADGRFVVAWSGVGQGRGQTVLARVFSADGAPASPEVRVPSSFVGGQRDASVAALPDGGFQLAWSGAGAGDFSGIFTRSFDRSASPLGPETRVNTSRPGIDRFPTLSVADDQSLAVAWQSLGGPLDRSGSGIVARLFGPDGAPATDPFLVNQTTRGQQAEPSAAFLSDGRLAVAWRGAGTGDADGVYLREFFGTGAPRSGETLVNSSSDGPQSSPSVVAQAAGGYVVAWSGLVATTAAPLAAQATADPSGIALRRFGDALITMPGNTPGLAGPSGVLWYDASATDPKFMKTITITNRSPTETIYPFLEDANNRTALPGDPAPSPTYRGTGMFNPFDPIDHEYRGYIGFSQGGVDYLGLLPGQSITINVPLAFWDALRINFTTDGDVSAGGSDLLGPNPAAPLADQLAQANPFLFRYANTQQKNVGSTTSGSNILTFTRIYNSFRDGMPYADPSLPTRPPEIVVGMSVTGPGLPGSGAKVIGVAGDTVTLDTAATLPASGAAADQTDAVYTFQIPTGTISPTLVYATDALSGAAYPGSIANGRVMWYHASISEVPLNDAPFQLTEATFRGSYYDPARNPGSGFRYLIGDSAFAANKFDLINYDVSYVDSMSLPVALEAGNVPIPNTGLAAPYGWAGSSQTVENQQALIRAFAASVGTYFGANGYPTYYNPDNDASIKLPSGQNIFKESPFLGTPSSYPDQAHFPDGSSINLPLYALTSGGVGPYQLVLGGGSSFQNVTLTPNQLLLNHTVDSDKALLLRLLQGLAAGNTYEATSSLQPSSDLPPDTTLTKVLTDASGVPTGVVELSNDTIAAYRGLHTYTFSRPVTDYAATAIMSLWYSWANYYANYVGTTLGITSPVALTGTVAAGQPQQVVLDPGQPDASKVVPGMAVSLGGASVGIVLAVSGQTVTLSQTVAAGPGSFTFTPPALSSLAGATDSTWKLLTPFTPEGPAVDFSRTVYSVMASMSTTLVPGDSYQSVRLLANIIGATISKLPNLNDPIQVLVTDQIKSLLRGVPDFTLPAYSDQSLWYPDPTLATGGQTFNVYNLDPFVWFVHEKLGLSGYGFSIDDDTSDVGANHTSHLFISIGGLGTPGDATALPNQNEWTTVAPYGPVTGAGTVATDPGSGQLTRISSLPVAVSNQVVGYIAPLNLVGSLVNGPGITPGTTVFSTDNAGNVTLSQPINLPAGSSGTFQFFGPLVARAQVGTAGQATATLVLQDDAAFATLQLLGPLSNLQVTGPGIEPGANVTVQGVTPATRTVTLSRPIQLASPPGIYAYTFGHATPVTS